MNTRPGTPLFERVRPGSPRHGRASSPSSRPAPTGSRQDWVPNRSKARTPTARASRRTRELRARATPDYEIRCKRIRSPATGTGRCERQLELYNVAVQRATRRASSAPTASSAMRTRSSGARASTPRGSSRRWSLRPEGGLGEVGATPPSLPRHHRRRLPEHVPALRAAHEPRLGLVPYTLECQFNYVIDAVRGLRERRPALDRSSARGDEALAGRDRPSARRHDLDERRLHPGTQMPPATTPTTGPALAEFWRRTRRINPADYRAAACGLSSSTRRFIASSSSSWRSGGTVSGRGACARRAGLDHDPEHPAPASEHSRRR